MHDPFDLTQPAALADPFPIYKRLRDEDPVHWSAKLRAWVLFRWEDVTAAFRDDERFSSDRSKALRANRGHAGPDFVRWLLDGLDGKTFFVAGPPAVLVADDDRLNRATLTALLEGEGYAVRAAADGQEALDGDGTAELLTGPGPSPVFATQTAGK